MLKLRYISVLLLFVYSFGYAQTLSPKCIEIHEEESSHHSHSHHDANDSRDAFISHNDHFDEDVFDLILCFFSESQHSNACNIKVAQVQERETVIHQAVLVPSDLLVYAAPIRGPGEKKNSLKTSQNLQPNYFVETSLLRGPPTSV